MAKLIHIESYIAKNGVRTYRAYFNKNLVRYRTDFFTDKDDALKEGIRLRASIGDCTSDSRYFLENPSSVFFDHWLEKYSKGKKESWRKDKTRLNMYIKPYLGKYKISQINRLLLENFFDWLKKCSKQRKITQKVVSKVKSLHSQKLSRLIKSPHLSSTTSFVRPDIWLS